MTFPALLAHSSPPLRLWRFAGVVFLVAQAISDTLSLRDTWKAKHIVEQCLADGAPRVIEGVECNRCITKAWQKPAVGHPEGYTATDIIARYKRMTGHNVLHPMGWDAFGLPAEQYAIETGTHPKDTTTRNVGRFREQLQSLGFSYDWDREVATCDPTYFKWTQWIFLQLLDRGLAYQAEVPVNWCPALGTVLANEEVIDGLSERGNHPVIRKPMKQWMLQITAYGDRLLNDLDDLDWPESIKEMQRNSIGRSEGAQLA